MPWPALTPDRAASENTLRCSSLFAAPRRLCVMKLRVAVLVGFLAIVPIIAAAPAAEPDGEKTAAEQVLKDAGVAVDGPGLLDYFRRQTLTDGQEKYLKEAVKR